MSCKSIFPNYITVADPKKIHKCRHMEGLLYILQNVEGPNPFNVWKHPLKLALQSPS